MEEQKEKKVYGICNRKSCKWHAIPTDANNCDYCAINALAHKEHCMRGCEPGPGCIRYEKGPRPNIKKVLHRDVVKLSDKDLRKLLEEGYSDTAIAKMHHMNSATIKRRRENMGIKQNHTKIINGKICHLTPRTKKEKDTNAVTR